MHDAIMVTPSVLHGIPRAVITQETVLFQQGPKPFVNPQSTLLPQQCLRRKIPTRVDAPTVWVSKPLPPQQLALFVQLDSETTFTNV